MVHQGVFLCTVIMAMDLAAGVLSITAQVADKLFRKTLGFITHSLFNQLCNQTRHGSIVVVLGIMAAVLAALAHMLANFFSCLCVSFMEKLEHSPSTRRLLFTSIISSWFIVATGLSVLIMGTIANIKQKNLCGTMSHYMLIGGICCFVHAIITNIWCYIFTLVTTPSGNA